MANKDEYISIIRPPCLHTVYKMRPIATDVARSVDCVSVCVLVTRMCCAKLAEPIEMPFGQTDF